MVCTDQGFFGVMLRLAMIGGWSIPPEVMPPWTRTASTVRPLGWAIVALDSANWRRLAPGEMPLPCAVLLGFGLVGFGLGARWFARPGRG